ncbi:MAG: hypothetical protein FJX72_16385, partial [Armatimonadetes bacterium]|nr:hypothetical protein [Armatimonadota bacterium]
MAGTIRQNAADDRNYGLIGIGYDVSLSGKRTPCLGCCAVGEVPGADGRSAEQDEALSCSTQ